MRDTPARRTMSPGDLMIVLVISLGSFMAELDATIVNIALPTIAKSFEYLRSPSPECSTPT